MRCFRDHACGGHQVCTYPSCLVAEDGSNSYRYHTTGSPAGGDRHQAISAEATLIVFNASVVGSLLGWMLFCVIVFAISGSFNALLGALVAGNVTARMID